MTRFERLKSHIHLAGAVGVTQTSDGVACTSVLSGAVGVTQTLDGVAHPLKASL